MATVRVNYWQGGVAMATVRVNYWRGTMRLTGTARTYRGAMRIAGRNRNAYGPTFFTPAGEKLCDVGGALVTERELERQGREGGAVVAYV